ncbi:SIMPL domain-containing protein [Sharpea azabuensis]|uniref:SIMPL domain-containing protein n=1 Tax=Sharpea azabuensis TaxID=322505 RepID=UPI00193228AE|nr:SIMPL domain-containing protein [Sharpea azabuensis]
MRTIRITGKGQIKVKPDMTRLTITLEDTYREYSETLKHSSEAIKQIKDLFLAFGFEKSRLKTLSFNVDTEYKNYSEHDTYKRIFVGYSYRQVLKIEFDSDNKLLGKILYALANSPLHPEFRISYTVKDPEAAKNRLLSKAMQDAKKKALVLSQAADVTLKDIQSIDYSFGELDLQINSVQNMLPSKASVPSIQDYHIEIEPDDIDVTDSVTVIWEIE